MRFLTAAPLYVWPLLILLLFVGLRSTKTSKSPIFAVLIVPAIFFMYSIRAFLEAYGTDLSSVLYWVFCISIGVAISFVHVNKLELKFDEKQRWVELPGSLLPLALFICVFILKFSIAAIKAQSLGSVELEVILVLELISAVILGLFLGRGISCFLRSRRAVSK